MGEEKRKQKMQKTKQYQIKTSKNSEEKRKKGKKKHSKLKKAILIFFIIIVLLILVAVGMVAGIFFSDKWKIEKDDLIITQQNSSVYDSEGNYLGQLVGDENRIIISLSEMGEYIPKAFVAIEDERFEEHFGIDIKRTVGATVQYVLKGGSSSYGGSTITQQLVKNMMEDKEDEGLAGAERKIREMSRAYQIEKMLSKDQILELYLNKIFMGGTVYGVESASQYYFAKSAKELSLAQSAFLAGINNAPNAYNPYDEENDHTELITRRTKTVLVKMKELGKITEEEYTRAIAEVEEGFEFKRGETSKKTELPFLALEAISEAASDLAKEKEIDYKAAYDMIESGGYKLYITLDKDVQAAVDKEMKKTTYVTTKTETIKDKNGKSTKVTYTTQAGMVVIDYRTGEVVAVGGRLGKDQTTTGLDYATGITRQPGSSIKPLANIAPGLEEKVITAATVYDDTKTYFGNWAPNNSTGYQGLCTVRKAIEVSSNVVNVKILSNVGVKTAVKYLNNFGLTNYNEENSDLTLGIGGGSGGTSPLQMAAAYGAIANKGEYIEPTFYEKLEDSNGKTVLEPTQEKRRILSEGNAYILSNILKSPVTGSSGTARACAISGMDVAAKTGTTDAAKDKWLCGFTPYYAAAVWYGYDAKPLTVYHVNAAKYIWSAVMKDVHKDLKNATFEKPNNIVTATICKVSGKLATDDCKSTYTEYFVKGTVPDKCDGHVTVKLCKESGKVATEFCPEVEEKTYTARPEKEMNVSWKTNGSDKYKVPEETCPLHTVETSKITVVNVVGKTEAEAKTALAGLTVQVIYEHNSAVANGTVIRQSLAPDTKVDKGVTIVITVNKLSGTNTGGNTENPGENTTPPGGNTTGGNTTVPGGNTETPGGNTTTPSNNTETAGENTTIPNSNT